MLAAVRKELIMVRLFYSTCSTLGELWCQAMHSDAMWPVKGEYQCRTCFRRYPVAWEAHAQRERADHLNAAVQPITRAEVRVM
jgi:hypothetical protein